MCQSLANPSWLEYWHIGETAMRFRKVTSRIVIGVKRCGASVMLVRNLSEPTRRQKNFEFFRQTVLCDRMTSAQIRQSFLDFFKSKGHSIVPSSSLMPDSPGLLFTNAGMNQFVPIFLNERAPDVDKWPGAVPGKPTRAADTQKCIRAGGKHNDLEDVGLDTYHHTFFEMLGNWSFGDYFKKEAIEWAGELVIGSVEKFPPNRIYATVYSPDKSKGDPSDFDNEAAAFWAAKFSAAGLDPEVHIVNGGKKDNFWMMGETGPCGPCSELHVDLTPAGDTKGALVNKGDARCIEIWNLVFIQFNANPDGTFSPLPAKHVDTGMGFERVTGIIQNTKGFKEFNKIISNYETDIFRPLFDKLEKLSGKKYGSTIPGSAGVPTASVGVSPTESGVRDARQGDRDGRAPHESEGVTYHKRAASRISSAPGQGKLWSLFSTREHRQLLPSARDIVLKSLLFGHEQRRYQLYAACVMPDHVHLLFEPQIKEQDKEGKSVFWKPLRIARWQLNPSRRTRSTNPSTRKASYGKTSRLSGCCAEMLILKKNSTTFAVILGTVVSFLLRRTILGCGLRGARSSRPHPSESRRWNLPRETRGRATGTVALPKFKRTSLFGSSRTTFGRLVFPFSDGNSSR